MTCIVGIIDGTDVWLGGDRASADADQWTQHPGATPKVLRFNLDNNTPALIGYTSSFRMADILWHCIREGAFSEAWERLDPIDHADVRMWIVGELIPVLQSRYGSAGFQRTREDVRKGGTFLFGLQGRLFLIQDDYAVIESAFGYQAVGCGEKTALGSLHTTRRMQMDPVARLNAALAACMDHLAYVLPPFDFVTTGDAK